ncbi:MAG: hypothetical protein AAB922_03080 [Patescibacteria group bacterium]
MIKQHTHDYRDINFRTFTVSVSLLGVTAATASNYSVFFTAHRPCELIRIVESHQAPGTGAGAVTLDIFKLTGTQDPDTGGVSMLASTFNLKSTANTIVEGTLTTTRRDRILAKNNRITLKDSGTLSSVGGLNVVLEFLLLDNI